MSASTKPTARYSDLVSAAVGHRAVLFLTEYPDKVAYTSAVLKYEQDTGLIETHNTIYLPDENY